ncbi:MAG: PilZ domain-containing protein [Thalassotalea sp.]
MPNSVHNNADIKLAKYNEYFSISHDFNINIKPLASSADYSFSTFLERIPTPFMLATQVVAIDNIALQPFQTVTGVSNQLAQYLTLQSQKIDLLMNYIITQQDEEAYRYQGESFSGSGISFTSADEFSLTDKVEIKLFLNIDNCNIYCHGEIIQKTESDNVFQYSVLFTHIRDDDRELLVRCSLHTQQKQLQALTKKRQDES